MLIQNPMPFTTTKWHGRLDGAASVHAILYAVRSFLSGLPRERLEVLPQECRPGPIRRDNDVDYWTFKLARHQKLPVALQGDPELLQELLNLFLHASMRISQLRRERSAPAGVMTH